MLNGAEYDAIAAKGWKRYEAKQMDQSICGRTADAGAQRHVRLELLPGGTGSSLSWLVPDTGYLQFHDFNELLLFGRSCRRKHFKAVE